MDEGKKKKVILISALVIAVGFLVYSLAVLFYTPEETSQANAAPGITEASDGRMPESRSDAFASAVQSSRTSQYEEMWDQQETGNDVAPRDPDETEEAEPVTIPKNTGTTQPKPRQTASSKKKSSTDNVHDVFGDEGGSGSGINTLPQQSVPVDDGWGSIDVSGGQTTAGEVVMDTYSRSVSEPVENVRCCFTKTESVKNGQRVTLRLMDELRLGDIVIPANTRVMGSCMLSDRMEITVSSVEFNHRVYNINLTAYDAADGMRGIYSQELAASSTNTVKNQGISLVGSALRSNVGRVASDVVSTGQSIAQNAASNKTIQVTSGYVFMLRKIR